jgi:nitrate/nitrite-specific signal transduction histidine kinase
MRITYKLYLVIAISLITIIGLGVVSYSGVKEINNRFDTLVQFPIPSILRLSNMTEAFLLAVEEAHSYQLYGMPEDKAGYYTNAREFDRLMSELKTELQYGTPVILQEDTDFIDRISAKVESVNQKITEEIAARDATGVLTHAATDPFAAEKDEVVGLLHQYRNMEKAEIENARAEVDAATGQVTSIILLTSLFLLIVILTINGLLARSITKPLRALGEAVKKLGEGDMNTRVEVYGKDEVAVLATAFNSMADSMQKLYFSLEAKIQERTAELERVRIGLEEAITERTAEIKKLKEDAAKASQGSGPTA